MRSPKFLILLSFDTHGVADAGDALPLTAGDGGQKRTRRRKQHPSNLPSPQLFVQVRPEHHRAATCSAAALEFVLDDVVDDFATVDVIFLDIHSLFP